MANYNTIRRLHLLTKKLSGKLYWSMAEISEYLAANDVEVNTRTIKRDFARLRTDYGLQLNYSQQHKGYRIEDDLSTNLELASRFFESSATSQIIKDVIKEPDQLKSVISYSTDYAENGSSLVKPLLDAINKSVIVTFTYENLKKEAFSKRRLEPYFLKEHKARWYLLGYDLDAAEFRLFGLDRVTFLQQTDEIFNPRDFNAREYFKGTFGVYVSSEQLPVEIQLEVKGLNGKLMEKVPVHPSQKLIKRDGDTFLFSLYVRPTVELRTYILSLGRHAKVLRPESLAEDVKKQLQLALEVYG